jgi:two-component system, chemotaxis family, response regulator Rcp1
MINPCDPIDILLVEDNEGDARLAKEVLKESKVPNNVYHVIDGVEAMSFLRREGNYADVPKPRLILLDLNLPRKDGREVLAEIKGDENLKRIPVVVLTISNEERDIIKSYNLQVNCFITKPIDFDKFLEVVRCIENFWLTIVQLPRDGSEK